jgi:hypothetical protein
MQREKLRLCAPVNYARSNVCCHNYPDVSTVQTKDERRQRKEKRKRGRRELQIRHEDAQNVCASIWCHKSILKSLHRSVHQLRSRWISERGKISRMGRGVSCPSCVRLPSLSFHVKPPGYDSKYDGYEKWGSYKVE